jgi:hypothetical protein
METSTQPTNKQRKFIRPRKYLIRKRPFILNYIIYCEKNLAVFSVPSQDITLQTLPGRELLNYSRPGRAWLMDIVTSRLGREKR